MEEEMINDGIEVSLMVEKPDIPACVEGKHHEYKTVIKNEYNQSGYRVDECVHCGLKISYDTSD